MFKNCLRSLTTVLVALAVLAGSALPASAKAGDLDPSFGVDGQVVTDLRTLATSDTAYAVAVQPDGKIVVAGHSYQGSRQGRSVGVARFNPNGSLDNSFGSGGVVTTDVGFNEDVTAVALDGNKILVGGAASGINGGEDFLLLRYNSNGSLDSGFGTNGQVRTSVSDYDRINEIEVGNGTISVAGTATNYNGFDAIAMAHYNSDGSLDSSFGNAGIVTTSFGGSHLVGALASDGDKLVVAANVVGNGPGGGLLNYIVRYNADGSLDNSFSDDGFLAINPGGGYYFGAIAVRIEAGTITVGYDTFSAITLRRYNPDGSPDTSFSEDGVASGNDNGQGFLPLSIRDLEFDGHELVATGYGYNVPGLALATARIDAGGGPDSGFGTGGVVVTHLGQAANGIAVALAPGRIIAVGSVTFTSDSAEQSDFAVVAYKPDGRLDTGFNRTGSTHVNLGLRSSSDSASDVAIQPDGKIVVVGEIDNVGSGDFAVARYNPDGKLDPGFGNGGVVTTDFRTGGTGSYDVARAVALDGGRIIVVGSAGSALGVACYTANGALDASFSADGKAIATNPLPNNGYSYNEGRAVTIAGGKIIVAGSSYARSQDVMVVRFNANGVLDATFDGDGIVITDLASSDVAADVAMMDGKIVVAGTSNDDFFLLRYNNDGTTDTTFSGDGLVVTDVGSVGDPEVFPLPTPYPTPTITPTPGPTVSPTNTVSPTATVNPTSTAFPTSTPGPTGTLSPPPTPVASPTQPQGPPVPVPSPLASPSPIASPTFNPTFPPTFQPTPLASPQPSFAPTSGPTFVPTTVPTLQATPTGGPTPNATTAATMQPTSQPTAFPTIFPTAAPTYIPLPTPTPNPNSTFSHDTATAIVIDGDKIIVAGGSSNALALLRYNSDGTLDTTFGSRGRAVSRPGNLGTAADVTVSGGKIITVNNNSVFDVTRFNADGTLDTTFGDGGRVLTPFDGYTYATAVAATPTTIVVAGTDISQSGDFAVARYLATGVAPPFVSVRGSVVTQGQGAGIPGITLLLGNNRQVSSDRNGNYNFSRIPPGTYTVKPLMTAALAGVSFSPTQRTITVGDQSVRDLNFIASFTLSGRVQTYLGDGIANVFVMLDNGLITSTDGNGRYTFRNVGSGPHSVRALGRNGEVEVIYTPSTAFINIERHNANNVNFYAGFTIRGQVTSGGLPVPNVLVQRRLGQSTVGVYTDSGGRYQFFNVRSGTYTVAPGYTPATDGFSFAPSTRTVTVNRSNVEFQDFVARFTLSGHIATSAGFDLANVRVNLSGPGVTLTTTTDSQGNYRFTNLPAGSYSIQPTLAGTTFWPNARFTVQVRTTNVTNQNFIAQ